MGKDGRVGIKLRINYPNYCLVELIIPQKPLTNALRFLDDDPSSASAALAFSFHSSAFFLISLALSPSPITTSKPRLSSTVSTIPSSPASALTPIPHTASANLAFSSTPHASRSTPLPCDLTPSLVSTTPPPFPFLLSKSFAPQSLLVCYPSSTPTNKAVRSPSAPYPAP
ncbi:hypothetical protein M5K25_004087 [Dendrobium thyrsiflorum]|uniref:Uncharacterized protein n=1 Tax=Dendrobium thyrsiflorum TaxID=117978 RepID=A0ABD0VKZ9_DENTH